MLVLEKRGLSLMCALAFEKKRWTGLEKVDIGMDISDLVFAQDME